MRDTRNKKMNKREEGERNRRSLGNRAYEEKMKVRDYDDENEC